MMLGVSIKKKLLELLAKGVIVGFSRELQPRIRGGKVLKEKCIRVYVEKKLPVFQLSAEEIIPEKIEGLPVDVVEVGTIRIQPRGRKKKVELGEIDTTANFRPLTAGVSVGNYAITAGTLSIPFYSSSGELVDSSNAHVFCDDPTKPVSGEKRICQAGPYDLQQRGESLDKWVSHEYLYHYQVYAVGLSNCPVAKVFTKTYNVFADVFGARTRLVALTEGDFNHVDVAFARRLVGSDNLIWREIKLEGRNYVGWLFAGSDQTTVICKVKYVLDKWEPYLINPHEPKVGDVIEKWGRTTKHTEGKVTDASAVVNVQYGVGKMAIFEDVILTEPMSQGGDSGSPCFLKE